MSSVKEVEVLILQEERTKDVSDEIMALQAKAKGEKYEGPVPATVAVYANRYDWIKRYSVEHMLGQDNAEVAQVLRVPDEVVREWGLKAGDKAVFDPKKGFKGITSVNGFTDPGGVRSRPRLVSDMPASYAERRLPIELIQLKKPTKKGEPDGNINNRAFTILAPLPEGGRVIIAAPARAGKSTTLRFVYEALLKLLEHDEKLFVIALQVGERPEDATKLTDIRDGVKHDTSRSELYLAPAGDPKEEPREGHYRLTKFAKARTERLCEGTKDFGYRVVLLIDSMSRVMMSHSSSEKIEKPKSLGLLSQGLSYASLNASQDILSVAGSFGERSITIITTMLKDEINVKMRKKSAEHVLFDQSGPSISTGIWGLVTSRDDELRPSIDLGITFTREFHEICTKNQFEEREYVLEVMWKSPYSTNESHQGRPLRALKKLIEYAKDHPTIESSQFAEDA